MKLDQIPSLLGCEPVRASDTEVTAVTEDSRRVTPGAVFVAAPGARTDGHAYAGQAVDGGAIAVVGPRPGMTEVHGVPYFHVDNPRKAAGLIAHALAGNPSQDMTVIGITGTNGKSSSVMLTHQILETCGCRAAAFGTLGYDIDGAVEPAKHTTPFGEDLAAMFKRAKDANQTHVAMEVSSHALDQDRVAGICFNIAAFTNLTQDHLDYHQDMDSYRRAKLKLFDQIAGGGDFTVVNCDDPSARYFEEASRVPCYTYGRGGDCRASEIQMDASGVRFRLGTPWGKADIKLALLGKHNVSNALCAVAICGGLGLPMEGIAEGVASLECVPGRLEYVEAGQDFLVMVDYAHTEDGLRNVLAAARSICRKRLILVFGCGGDRDRGKRPKMAGAAAELADFSVITSDNPRTEDPERILLDIESGIQYAGKKKDDDYIVICDRAEAIRRAIEMARTDDVVLIAGKGHEDYQIIGTQRIHFDDREVARHILDELNR